MKTALIVLAALLFLYIAYRTYRFIKQAEGLDAKIASGAILLDVRTAAEYATGHIDGSKNISLGSIREKYTELDPQQAYITTCSHGLRSVKAAALLKERGFKKVYNGGALTDLEKIVKAQKKKQ